MTPEESAMVRDVLGDGYYVLLPSINEIKGIYSETVPWAKPRSLEHKEIAAERIIALVAERDRLAAALRDLLNAVGGETWSAMEETRAKKAARAALAAADRPEGTTPDGDCGCRPADDDGATIGGWATNQRLAREQIRVASSTDAPAAHGPGDLGDAPSVQEELPGGLSLRDGELGHPPILSNVSSGDVCCGDPGDCGEDCA